MNEYKRHPNTQCLICGQPIYRRKIDLERSHGKAYCSSACYGNSCRKEKPCLVCGKPILANKHKKTCCRSCANINRSKNKYKLFGPHKDKAKWYRALKTRLLKIRGIKCERCGYNKFEILQVHHKDKDRKNNNLDNLELICPNCHFEEHYLENSWFKQFN